MTTVVTGASGHLGANLIRSLGDGDLRAVVHGDVRPLQGLPVEQVRANLADQASLRKAFHGASTVFHLASLISITGDPDGRVYATNVQGARNVAQAALDAGVKRLIHVSSIHAFDLKTARDGMNEHHPRAGARSFAYDHSKALGESEVRKAVARGLDATIVNPSGIIGPWDFKPSRMGQVFLDLAQGRLPALVAGGFDFVDVRDVVASMIAAVDRGATGENYLLCGRRHSLHELALAAHRATGVPPPKWSVPVWLAKTVTPFAVRSARRRGAEPHYTRESLGAVQHCPVVDDSKARRELGHNNRPADASVQDIYAWFRRDGRLT